MSNQVQMPGAGMIGFGVFIVAFVLLMVIGHGFLSALVFALAVALGVAIFFLLTRDREKVVAETARASAPTAAPLMSTPAKPAVTVPEPAVVKAQPAPVPPEPVAVMGQVEPPRLDMPRGGAADDLKRIKGVGPKIEALLHRMGIFHLDQIARWGAEEVAWMDEHLEDFRGRVSRDDWVGQARHLAGGGETEFSRRVDEGEVYD